MTTTQDVVSSDVALVAQIIMKSRIPVWAAFPKSALARVLSRGQGKVFEPFRNETKAEVLLDGIIAELIKFHVLKLVPGPLFSRVADSADWAFSAVDLQLPAKVMEHVIKDFVQQVTLT